MQANQILRALAVNASSIKLKLKIWVEDAAEETCAALSEISPSNNAIKSIFVDFPRRDPQRYLEAYAQELSSNRLILSFGYCVPGGTHNSLTFWAPVRRNRAVLNLALDFILEHPNDRHCAQCFELFFGHFCPIADLTKIAGMSGHEFASSQPRTDGERSTSSLRVSFGIPWFAGLQTSRRLCH
ncbi:hypothetical protein HPB51_027223 [Rhipicephalus microplus]|uniref:Uncharacterized protein n=1 Tax=Rhipicephalus microplus TaxID=6941 RepID=A0A9J6D0T5_RHIMP|nr:hypothetical protein HPB51_027223 [Rhipicephalus microplus]